MRFAFDAGRSWQAEGARSASAWLTRRCGLASSTARRRVRLGRALRHMLVAERAWLAGEMREAQVAALARARTPTAYETFAGRICQLANGTVVSPGSLVPWLESASVERVVFDVTPAACGGGAARSAPAGRRAGQLPQ